MKKACKKCKMLVKEDICPNCGNNAFTETWKGRIVIFKPTDSVMAQKMTITKPGIYAIKTR